MDIALPSFILGYHGCDQNVAEAVFAGTESLQPSENDYDWLGDGVYFWEHNPLRAYDFAVKMAKRPHPSGQRITCPAVIGAIINLGLCLNLLDSAQIRVVRQAHTDLVSSMSSSGQPMPQNTGGPDLVDRKLDCAVIRFVHKQRAEADKPPFDTVRAAFFEGGVLYPGAGFAAGNHIQVCVRTPRCVVGYFRVLDATGRPRRFG